ncbi:acyl-homoserine-lactone synthase [Bradyrhizobium sp. NAS96.2]|uniref:acyl-homoserine-lactone synthase n=1 Tax=Bradyrhizobium sp. NAS96.2 TaxID=1680160 RepID=UPI00093C0573|nr:acyl-homoserine-lactone synthase [Bradyrhizobium sp. NAS96.2]OKO78312.1 conjugal transfer protein TraI [Bradyrhizobium sp. NAS96.2]
MHAVAIESHQFGENVDLLTRMYQLRRRIFHDRLEWDVSVSNDMELDVFDTLSPSYLAVLSDRKEVLGCVRLLPTTGPTMLGDVFASLLAGAPMPRDRRILESSRFCVDTQRLADTSPGGLSRATFMLFAAMIEYLRRTESCSIVTVTDVRMERILRRAGWPLQRIAPPQPVGRTMALAGYLHGNDSAFSALCRQAHISSPVLGIPMESEQA